jgi:hypothetical protein
VEQVGLGLCRLQPLLLLPCGVKQQCLRKCVIPLLLLLLLLLLLQLLAWRRVSCWSCCCWVLPLTPTCAAAWLHTQRPAAQKTSGYD